MSEIGRRRASVFQQGQFAGYLEEKGPNQWIFEYDLAFEGEPISLTMPLQCEAYVFAQLPPIFEGLLPEGGQLEALLKIHKIDRNNHFAQLIAVGSDMVGSLVVKPAAGIKQ